MDITTLKDNPIAVNISMHINSLFNCYGQSARMFFDYALEYSADELEFLNSTLESMKALDVHAASVRLLHNIRVTYPHFDVKQLYNDTFKVAV